MKQPFYLLLISLLLCHLAQPTMAQQNQYLISSEWKADLAHFPGADAVKIFKLIYNTVDPFGEPTIASGAFVVPRHWDCDFPLVSYQHGTILNKNDVPSALGSEGILAAVAFAQDGYACAAPDYLGLGESPGLHPFMHSKTHASSVIDMLRAVREFAAEKGIQFNDQLFLLGYSQGGHVTMAAQRSMLHDYPEEFKVTASAPGSGPYDVSGVQTDVLTSDDPYPAPGYMPYVIFSYQMIYGNLYDNISDVFKPPYDETIPPYYGHFWDMSDVDEAMPDVPKTIIYDSFYEPFINDPNHPMRVALRDNDITDWVPQAPTRMYYCTADRHVPHGNSLVAEEIFLQNGAPDIAAVSLQMGDVFEHELCFGLAFAEGKAFIDGFRNDCSITVTGVDEFGVAAPLSAYPNPASISVRIEFSNPENKAHELTLFDFTGKMIRKMELFENTVVLNRNQLPSGIYIAVVQSEEVRYAGKVIFD